MTNNNWLKWVELGENEDDPAIYRMIYLCEIGDIDQHLSEHLRSAANDFGRLQSLNGKLRLMISELTSEDKRPLPFE